MPITLTNPFKGRQYPGEVIVLCVRRYLRYPLAYQHVSEILAERGVEVADGPRLARRARLESTEPVPGALAFLLVLGRLYAK